MPYAVRRARKGVKASERLELAGADLPERRAVGLDGRRLHAVSRVVGDPGGEVHGATVVVALAEDEWVPLNE
ncbi:MAG TPA: hypothetical protein VHK22_03720 [Gaiellaceae bacterium]|nr:hypothetical protein [Gaiellaceae bacterium]